MLISHVEQRRHDDDLLELDDLLSGYRHNYRPKRPHIVDQIADDDQDTPSYDYEKPSPSRKKVLDENDDVGEESNNNDDDDDNRLIPAKTNVDDASDKSTCVSTYDVRLEQLVKVKDGAHMIRHFLVDKRTLKPNLNVQDTCMTGCCEEKTCDLAMLSEKPTNDGFKCYLFACNGSCPFASHQDYKIMIPKKDSAYYTKSIVTSSTIEASTATTPFTVVTRTKSHFRELSVILLLVFGILITISSFVLLCCYCGKSRKMGRKSKNYSVDADYLINGLYL
ncbi:unnamed protein product [Rotaria magnacalcarata]|uniref:Seven cysteines N-terminal domain-containing protein n=2 Tax=Rotaria magnacalcarata TaxID=392030 RepID=A0A816LS55_9BILA|nr:unnamed protein product [Rotaria magnacalcarata]